MSGISAEQALTHWQKSGKLTAKKADELRRDLHAADGGEHANRAVIIFATVGAILVGLGIIFFVSSNWEDMGPLLRGAVLFLAYGIVAGSAYVCGQRNLPKVEDALWFLATIVLGADIFLLAQIFHYSLTYWQGPGLWLLGCIGMGFARKKDVYGVLAVPLFLFMVGWMGYASSGLTDQMGILFEDTGLRPVLALLGIAFVGLGLMLRRTSEWGFLSKGSVAWGVLLFSVPLLAATATSEVLEEFFTAAMNTRQILLGTAGAVIAVAAFSFGGIKSFQAKILYAIAALLSVVFLFQRGGESVLGKTVDSSLAYFAIFVLLMFALALYTVWVGLQEQEKTLVNIGLAATTVIIIIQYFSWTFELLDRSLAFIIGGILLIALAVGMERARRLLLARISK